MGDRNQGLGGSVELGVYVCLMNAVPLIAKITATAPVVLYTIKEWQGWVGGVLSLLFHRRCYSVVLGACFYSYFISHTIQPKLVSNSNNTYFNVKIGSLFKLFYD